MAPGRKRVGFTSDSTPDDGPSSSRNARRHAEDSPVPAPESGSGGNTTPVALQRADVSHEELSEEIHKAFGQPYVPKPRPAIRKGGRTPPRFQLGELDIEEDENEDKRRSGLEAQKRATKLSKSVGTYSSSAPGSRRNSNDRLMGTPPIELRNLRPELPGSVSTDEDDDDEAEIPRKEFIKQADQLLRHHTTRRQHPVLKPEDLYHTRIHTPLHSGPNTPTHEVEIEAEHVPKPPKFRTGVLGTLLKASGASHSHQGLGMPKGHARNASAGSFTLSGASTAANTPNHSPPSSGAVTPDHHKSSRAWYSRSANTSTHSISQLIESSSTLATPGQRDLGYEIGETYKKQRPGMGKRHKSNNSIMSSISKFSKTSRDEKYRITVHLAGTLARQNYLRKLCKALMMFGAPTHRLEEYMNMSARVLEIEAQFLYMPGCMIIAFDDSSVHTSEVKLVRTAQGVDLGRLRDVHEIYKDVVHDRINVEEATTRLEAIIGRDPKFKAWLRVPVYGLASAMVGPFAFQARPIDMPFCFMLGCFLGWLQLIVTPTNELISNVFEIGAAVITSFLARGLGSIRDSEGKEIFCFSAMAQSSIALILPGFTVLCASLELQSKHMVAGSVRMVYAIIYSLFLGFGITIGTVLFGLMYNDATSRTECVNPMNPRWYYLFVVGFTICLTVINQAKYKQMPAMLCIALIGYAVNYNSSQYFKGNAQVSNTLGALSIGVVANIHARFGRHVENWSLDFWESKLRPRWVKIRKSWQRRRHGPMPQVHVYNPTGQEDYFSSRGPIASNTSDAYIPRTRKIGYGLAAAAMLPAIFVQVPSGLSVSGSLVSGIMSADQITRNTTGVTTVTASESGSSDVNRVALNVGFSVIQVAIGITVGLFLAALLVYPLGKRRSGLFSF
ncbi:DUF1212-domain-containing protein [Aaosphaeria arxii CBS 175.79]|uniref:DUF1212-domain-containing protein n=1 Tax=Aaosphaeria arxii CBS 175.79 TaxID=1450172 RepID=A0A6A5X9B6_9PLEO|nr:DUF1212-domain-containing protein [Aaosphaeria arxii CBS 175.79]KAF2009655.1 DUF1212-domain-containing protein [Aaosphaeria arxii CBS 175.79]